MTEPRFTRADKLSSLMREIGYRERVYPRLVSAGKMLPYTAVRELEIMREIAADYEPPREIEAGE